jgi:S-DNA-T family DNA segregation ATPase FtsK/SpoIIIE
VPETVDLMSVHIGQREDGRPWLLRLLGTHVLVAGVTGSGKGSVIWSLLRAAAPSIRSGLVQVWAVDPKGGMELGLGGPLYARFAHVDYEQIVDLLGDAVTVMKYRAARLAGHVRQHIPTVEEPLIVVLVDEVANLTAYLPNRDLRRRADAALALLLTQGRAVGVSVVAALQDPRKEILNHRNLSPPRSRSASTNRPKWTWSSATEHATAAHSPTRSRKPHPVSATSAKTAPPPSPASALPTSPTTRSASSPPTTPRLASHP